VSWPGRLRSPPMKVVAARPPGNATLLLAATVVVWGCTGRVIAVGAPHSEPITLTMMRAVPAAVLLLAALPFLRCHLRAVPTCGSGPRSAGC